MKRNKIIEYRKKIHLSPDYIANYLGISKYDYIHKELGDIDFTEDELESLCNVFGVERKDLDEPSLEEKANKIAELEKIIKENEGKDKVVQSVQNEIEEIMESLSLQEMLELNDIVLSLSDN